MWFFNKKQTIADSGILNRFVDWHSHLLPGVDDGVKQIEESLSILDRMQKSGTAHVVLTPHVMEDIPNTPNELNAIFENLSKNLIGDIQISLGTENMLDSLFSARLSERNLQPLFGNMLLVETSYFSPPINLDGILSEIFHAGYFPVLAHPERYRYMDISDYERLKRNGVKFQLNVTSIIGSYGREAHDKSHMLLKKGYYDMAGLDIHRETQYEHFLHAEIANTDKDRLKDLIDNSNSFMPES